MRIQRILVAVAAVALLATRPARIVGQVPGPPPQAVPAPAPPPTPPSPPAPIVGRGPAPPPQAVPASAPPLTAAIRADVVDTVAAELIRFYSVADTGRMIADHLRNRLRAGVYDQLTDPRLFAEAVSVDMR